MKDVCLSSSTTEASYRQLEGHKDREGIADFVLERFTERYIAPLCRKPKHGFCTMAVNCLMIEAMESFFQGWADTKGQSKEVFRCFFSRCEKECSALGVFYEHSEDFYESVRCGILHQAETTNGWRIRRDGPILDPRTKTINATLFHKEVAVRLQAYCELLTGLDWDDEVWKNLRKKMASIIEHC